jgi:hypothetical protein
MKKNYNLCLVVGLVLGLFFGSVYVQAADTPGMTGIWEFKVKYLISGSPSTSVEYFDLKQEGQKITGTREWMGTSLKVTGDIIGNNFELVVTNATREITYVGKVEGNKVTGSSNYVDVGSSGFKVTFTGERK